MFLKVGKQFSIIYDDNTVTAQFRTENLFGDVYETLAQRFAGSADDIAARLADAAGRERTETLWGFNEYGNSLWLLDELLTAWHVDRARELRVDGENVERMQQYILPTLERLVVFRSDRRLSGEFLTPSLWNGGTEMVFSGLKTLAEVALAALYFYAYHGLKLVRCAHCGRWFASASMKQEFCGRKSPCSDLFRDDSVKACEQTVRELEQRFRRWRKNFKDAVYQQEGLEFRDSRKLFALITDFDNNCSRFNRLVRAAPTAENYRQYNEYLSKLHKKKPWLPEQKSKRGNKNGT